MSVHVREGNYATAEEYAKHLGVSYATVKRWCQSHRSDVDAPCVKFGRTWLIRVKAGK